MPPTLFYRTVLTPKEASPGVLGKYRFPASGTLSTLENSDLRLRIPVKTIGKMQTQNYGPRSPPRPQSPPRPESKSYGRRPLNLPRAPGPRPVRRAEFKIPPHGGGTVLTPVLALDLPRLRPGGRGRLQGSVVFTHGWWPVCETRGARGCSASGIAFKGVFINIISLGP